MPLLSYHVEYELDEKVTTIECGEDLAKARKVARRLSKNGDIVLTYVIASTATDRVGGECYAHGRRDHTDGVMIA